MFYDKTQKSEGRNIVDLYKGYINDYNDSFCEYLGFEFLNL